MALFFFNIFILLKKRKKTLNDYYRVAARQVFGIVAGEKLSVDIDNSAIDSTLDQF